MVYRLVSYVLGAAVAVNAALNDSSTLSFTNATSGNVTLFQPLFPAHSNSTPRFQNVSGVTANPLIQVLNNLQPSNHTLGKRQSASNGLPTGTCAPGTPCSNGACCSNTGICGYAPAQCGSGTCISNCDAKAECGQYGVAGAQDCPLNVCCSYFGFCGTTDDFCDTGTSTPCQSDYGECGPAPAPSCSGGTSTNGRTIGYYESWSSSRACDSRTPNDLDLTALTHVNFAFAYMDPSSFQITPMDPGDTTLYSQFTALKTKKQGLQTWISIGGWSFNDATNTPNTQTAFSDMASSASNRKTFISALTQFMTTYSFDGVDIDWEYPGAPDRGGVPADTANFVTLLQELRAAFGSDLGISCTLPSSYWYLQWFDVKSMQNYVDWFNFMSYDLHGVWDSTNQYTGPYIEPHTNWTEIEQGLDLLWRAGVSANNVNLGLGWYGRSFTLADSTCNTPGCVFTAGGNPGQCTNSSGTLSNAEINRIISANGLTPTFNEDAAVNWITWDSNQWVSYDNGPSVQLKLQRANALCLGGTMIWAIDLDDSNNTSKHDLLGIGTSSGVSALVASAILDGAAQAQEVAAIQNSCYWSLCGESCSFDYFGVAQSTGQVGGITQNTICPSGEAQTLCCAPGTTLGTCEWDGFQGVGLGCSSTCSNPEAVIVAANTNHWEYDPNTYVDIDQTCSGGYQVYCCAGFVASPITNTNNLNLIGRSASTPVSKRNIAETLNRKRGSTSEVSIGQADQFCLQVGDVITSGFGSVGNNEFGSVSNSDLLPGLIAGAVGDGSCLESVNAATGNGAVGYVTDGILEAACARKGKKYTYNANSNACQPYPKSKPKPKQPKAGTPKTVGKPMGQWARVTYASTMTDCAVTYTCKYGLGWDEVCDNQRWAITSGLNGRISYNRGARSGASQKLWWKRSRAKFYATQAQTPVGLPGHSTARCQLDEFPMGALAESSNNNFQVIRLLDGAQNGRQGTDFNLWLLAEWEPCSTLRALNNKPEPPIYWEFGPIPPGDPRLAAVSQGSHFVSAFGFEYPGQATTCFASYSALQNANGGSTVVLDHGFRALPGDPMFYGKQWPSQDYWNYETQPVLPGGLGAAQPNYATNVASANYAKRQIIKSVLEGKLKTVDLSEEDLETATMIVDQFGEEAAIILNKWEDPSSPRPTTASLVTGVPIVVESHIDGSTTAVLAAARMTESEPPMETGARRHANRHHGHSHRRAW